MANVNGKQVADGSHNVIYKEAVGAEIPALIVNEVTSGENVKYKIAEAGDTPGAVVNIVGATFTALLYDGFDLLYDGSALLY